MSIKHAGPSVGGRGLRPPNPEEAYTLLEGDTSKLEIPDYPFGERGEGIVV
jgi:hypothetical protein